MSGCRWKTRCGSRRCLLFGLRATERSLRGRSVSAGSRAGHATRSPNSSSPETASPGRRRRDRRFMRALRVVRRSCGRVSTHGSIRANAALPLAWMRSSPPTLARRLLGTNTGRIADDTRAVASPWRSECAGGADHTRSKLGGRAENRGTPEEHAAVEMPQCAQLSANRAAWEIPAKEPIQPPKWLQW
jgi:hypothetical protein